MKNILHFDKMLTPKKIITIVYWFLLLSAVITELTTMFSGYGGFVLEKFIMGIVYTVGGAVGARIWCELLIVLFKGKNLGGLRLSSRFEGIFLT